MAKRRLSPADLDRLAERREAGASYRELAAEFGCSESAISWQCLRLGADPPKPPRPRPTYHLQMPLVRRGNHMVRAFTPAEDARLLELEQQGLGNTAIGRALDRRPNSVRNRLMTLARHDERAAVP